MLLRQVCLFFVVLVAGCVSGGDLSLPLDRQLAGQSTAQQETILRLNCLNDAEKIARAVRSCRYRLPFCRDDADVRGMKGLCFAMLDARSADTRVRKHLADQCSTRLSQIADATDSHVGRASLIRMATVCEAMTSLPVSIAFSSSKERLAP